MRRLGWVMVGLLLMCLIAQPLTIALISGYQRFISPRKGWQCAYAVLHRTTSCSEYGKSVIAQYGVFNGTRLLWKRFDLCRLAAAALSARASGDEEGVFIAYKCCGPPSAEDVGKAMTEIAREAEKAAENWSEAAKRDVFKSDIDAPFKRCPACNSLVKIVGEDENHRWYKCNNCAARFALYVREPHPANPYNTPDLKGQRTFYAADRWLHAGNKWFLPGRVSRARKWWQIELLEKRAPVKVTGMTKQPTPLKGAIAVFEDPRARRGPPEDDNSLFGHVAYVEDVRDDTFIIRHMNSTPPGVAVKWLSDGKKTVFFNLMVEHELRIDKEKGCFLGNMRLLGFIHPQVAGHAAMERPEDAGHRPEPPAAGHGAW